MALFWKISLFLVFSYFNDDVNAIECPPFWTKYMHNCYRFFGSEPKTWEEAQNYCCENFDSNLVSVTSASEQEFVIQLWRSSMVPDSSSPNNPRLQDSLWIGLFHDCDTFWAWTYIYMYASTTFWLPGEPNGDGECAHMWKNNAASNGEKWNDVSCDQVMPFMCEMSYNVQSCIPWQHNGLGGEVQTVDHYAASKFTIACTL